MSLVAQLQRQIDDPTLTPVERTQLCCQLAKELEEAGDYEAARQALAERWQHVGERPRTGDLERHMAAELLMRAGSLSGWIGSARQIEGSQEIAKDLITESITLFEELGEIEKVCEAQVHLAVCYWREGAFDEARVMLKSVLGRVRGWGSRQEVRALLNLAMVERSANRGNASLSILLDAAPLVDACDSHALKGNFHNQLGAVLKTLGAAEGRTDYTDRALVEYAAASFHYAQSGNVRFRAVVENNLGYLFMLGGRFRESHEHLDRAQRLFVSLKDSGSIAQLNDTRARALLAEGRNARAERLARSAVRALEKGDGLSLLAQALTTWGVSLARTGQHEEARMALARAVETAYQAGDNESAGLAAITAMEELSEKLPVDELQWLYQRADALLVNSQNTETLERLRACARSLMAERAVRLGEFPSQSFVYGSERTGELLHRARLIALTQETLLITGEAGTGKELVARLVHEWSGRAGRFVKVDCAALADALIESQLFGHRQGSFESALEEHAGAVREAAGGTLFLDNVARLSAFNQGKLMRLVEWGEIHAIGASAPERVDVRIIASAGPDLTERLRSGQFREDLFHRLNTFHLITLPLSQRPEDIPALAAHFIKEAAEQAGKRVELEPEAVEALQRLPLKGNAGELRTLMERTVAGALDGTVIKRSAVETLAARRESPFNLLNPWEGCSLKKEVLSFESEIVRRALETAGGSVTHASRLLGITHQRLCAMLQGRHKNLLLAKKMARPRKRSLISRISD